MAYADPRRSKKDGAYFRVFYQQADGSYTSVSRNPDTGERFRSETAAVKWGREKEAKIRAGLDEESAPSVVEAARRARASSGETTLGELAGQWFVRLEQAEIPLAVSTMSGYRRNLELHILPYRPADATRDWYDTPVIDITEDEVIAWRSDLRASGYSEGSIGGYNGVLYSIMSDAVEQGIISRNPVARKRNRGARSAAGARRGGRRGPERAAIDPLGALLHAERMALLVGRDDEFVLGITKCYTGLRSGELFGLEREYVRPGMIRVEHQLFEHEGEWHRQPPKENSYRDVHIPPFLEDLLARQMDATRARRTAVCSCRRPARVHRYLAAALKRRGEWGEAMEERLLAASELGEVIDDAELLDRFADRFVLRPKAAPHAGGVHVFPGRWKPHHDRATFKTAIFEAAATGRFPSQSKAAKAEWGPTRPVPLSGGAWPGVPILGRSRWKEPEASWLPIAPGLTPHGQRHSHIHWMDEDGIPEVLKHERVGHSMGGISAVYRQVTQPMVDQLMEALVRRWEESLRQRAAMHPRSPVSVLDTLLEPYRTPYSGVVPLDGLLRKYGAAEPEPEILSQKSPKNTVVALRPRQSRKAS
ncbi:hypothetical protein [Nocardiopsis sp. YSL2]|uniref:hypothetical protein n=1 Tax=Nocardiopsis sp. YSL2 TaxID=2939492 RepID=UPI0026F40EB6|nr:hypothetical protein [Nocardiopsis sp. YSL2]